MDLNCFFEALEDLAQRIASVGFAGSVAGNSKLRGGAGSSIEPSFDALDNLIELVSFIAEQIEHEKSMQKAQSMRQ